MENTMNKSDLIDFVATNEDVTSKASAKRIVDALVDKIVESIGSGSDLSIAGLGTFYVVAREAREGRNPQTGEPLSIPAKKVPKFRASSKLKEAVNV
jgi:DNA-binding protein HU-beta